MTGVTYLKGKAGIHRAFVQSPAEVTAAALEAVLNKLANVHEIVVTVNGAAGSATSSKALHELPASPAAADGAAQGADSPPRGDAAAAAPGPRGLAALSTRL